MTDRQRVQHCAAFLLHQRPFRDSSRIVDLFSREHGRVSLVARRSRQSKRAARVVLQAFQPLSVSWSIRAELGSLSASETDGPAHALVGDALLAGFYMNELILKLTHRFDPQPEVYALYDATLAALTLDGALEPSLRRFELRLLGELGYGLQLGHDGVDGAPLAAGRHYRVAVDTGPLPVAGPRESGLVFSGEQILAVANEALDNHETCKIAQRITRAAIDRCLEGRSLNTRKVLLAMRQRQVQEDLTQ